MKLTSLILLVIVMTSAHADDKSYETKMYANDLIRSKGLKRSPEKFEKFKMGLSKRMYRADVAIPKAVDLSPKVSPPETQGSCGSCWSFAITKALRSEFMLAGKDPGRLAFNYLLNNCGGADYQYGCMGGDFPAGLNMINGLGPWLETQDPYTGREGTCKRGLPVAATALTWNLVGDGNSAPSFKQIASAVAQGHMLAIDVLAGCGDWSNYSGGIYNGTGCSSRPSDHMIDLTGYDCQTSVDANGNCVFNSNGQPVNGDGYLKVQNNWGERWGEGGYMRTRWGRNGIARTAMFFEIKKPAPSPTPSPTPTVTPLPSPVPTPIPTPSGFDYQTAYLVLAAIFVFGMLLIGGLLVNKKP